MTQLEKFDNNGLELIINTKTGEVLASQSAISRMCNVSQPAISKNFTHNQITFNKARVLTATGLKTHNLYPEDIIYQALAKYNPQLLTQCAKAGLRMYLHGLAGYRYTIQEAKPKTALELAKEQVKLLEKLEILELENEQLETENHQLSEAVDELFNYSSIIRVAKFNNCPETNFKWRRLKVVSQQLDIEIKKVPCPRFGQKNIYCHDVWRVAYPDFALSETTTLRIG